MAKTANVLGAAVWDLTLEASTVSRRRFLQALAALGASIALPVPVEQASAQVIDAAWSKAVEAPWHFSVNEWGTIVARALPSRRSGPMSSMWRTWRLRDPEDLICEVESVPPLLSAFQSRTEDHCLELEAELDGLSRRSLRRAQMQQLLEELSDPDDGWMGWIRHEGTAGIDQFWEFIEQWLAEPVDWNESDWFPRDWDGQGQAYRFFQGLDPDVRDALGIVVVEGDHPGSDYFAAELRSGIDGANAKATELGLPFRFRPEGVRS